MHSGGARSKAAAGILLGKFPPSTDPPTLPPFLSFRRQVSVHEKSRYARYVFECMRMDIARQSFRPAQSPARFLSLS